MPGGPTLEIRNTTRGMSPRVPFEALAKILLPKQYQLSLVLCGDSLSRRINRQYRKKQYVPNVLSFPYSEQEGEIFINLRKAATEAHTFGILPRDRVAHLFVHACLHVRGWKHGERMDKRERQLLKKFGFQAAS